jgi:hypothetical protein
MDNTILISDIEGYKIDYFLPDMYNGNIYILGDFIDSTASSKLVYTLQPDDDNIENIIGYELFNKKSFNLYNIHTIITNPKIKIILGNRDLNKIRLLFALELDDNVKYKEFNEGLCNLTFDNFIINYNSTLKLKYPMKLWKPIWNPEKLSFFNEGLNACNIFTCMEIFTMIFTYSFSASYLLETIYNEIIKLNFIQELLQIDLIQNYKAFLVIAIFRSLLMKNDDMPLPLDFSDNTTKCIKGLLYKLYNKATMIEFVDLGNNKDLLLSHGGITKYFLNTYHHNNYYNFIYQFSNIKYENIVNEEEIYNIIEKSNYTSTETCNLKQKCNNFNTIYTKYLLCIYNNYMINGNFKFDNTNITNFDICTSYQNFINNKIDISVALSFFLIMTTSILLSKNNLYKLINSELTQPINGYINIISPIGPGYEKIMKETDLHFEYTTNRELYQIFGHQPFGFATSYCKIRDNHYLICIDTSNSFAGTYLNNNIYKNYIKINKGNIISYTNFKFNIINKQIFNNTTLTDSSIWEKQLYYSSDFTNTETENKLIINLTHIAIPKFPLVYIIGTNKLLFNYHGQFNNFYYFTTTQGFNKIFYILNNDDLNTFIRIMNIYQNKYLKYKKKYLSLK